MSDSQARVVTDIEEAKAFLEFQYPEIKDLTKQFLTVVAAVLAVSVTFSEKIVVFAQASKLERVLLIITWVACLMAFILGGASIFLIYNAGVSAKYTQVHSKPTPYRKRTWHAYLCLDAAGICFVLGFMLLGFPELFALLGNRLFSPKWMKLFVRQVSGAYDRRK